MKKHILVFGLIAAALIGNAIANDPPTASPGPRCRHSSWDPTLFNLYGAKDTILEKMASISANLTERRVFLQVTQGDSSAEIRLYEQKEGGTYAVTKWTTKETAKLLADIDQAIVDNKGVDCVGEKVKDVLAKELGAGKPDPDVPAPASTKAAFAESVKNASGDFIKTTLIILC